MSEDLTQNLPSRPFEERVLAELAAMRRESAARFDSLDARVASVEERMASLEGRMTTLEGKVEERLHDTRPMWEGVQQRLTNIETGLDTLNRQFRTLIRESFDLRSRVEKLEDDRHPS